MPRFHHANFNAAGWCGGGSAALSAAASVSCTVLVMCRAYIRTARDVEPRIPMLCHFLPAPRPALHGTLRIAHSLGHLNAQTERRKLPCPGGKSPIWGRFLSTLP